MAQVLLGLGAAWVLCLAGLALVSNQRQAAPAALLSFEMPMQIAHQNRMAMLRCEHVSCPASRGEISEIIETFDDPLAADLRDSYPTSHPGGVELRANLKSISHRCYLFEVAFEWELTKETIDLPLGCLQGGTCESVTRRPTVASFFPPNA